MTKETSICIVTEKGKVVYQATEQTNQSLLADHMSIEALLKAIVTIEVEIASLDKVIKELGHADINLLMTEPWVVPKMKS